MKCQACNGEIKRLFSSTPSDQKGVCVECGAAYLTDKSALATSWCTCADTTGLEIFFFSDNGGGHGWLHAVCGGINNHTNRREKS